MTAVALFFWLGLLWLAFWGLWKCWKMAVRAHRDLQRFNRNIEASAKLLQEREEGK